MKYDFCNIKAYSFEEMLSMKNKKFVILSCMSDVDENSEGFNPSEVYYFDEYCKLRMLGGEDASKVFVYESLICCDFYLVSEVKEEPKSVITENKDILKEQENNHSSFSEILGKFWSKQPLEKPPIDTNRVIIKEGLSDINNDLIINDFNFTAHIRSICREEIKKKEINQEWLATFVKDICQAEIKEENKTRYVFPNMKAQNQAYSLNVLDKIKEITEVAEKIKAKHYKKQKKPKQELDGEKKIYIKTDGSELACKVSYFTEEQMNRYGFKTATQQEINQFFKGSKKRKPAIGEWTLNKEGYWQRKLGNNKTEYRTN